ncbi:MAG: hypothetical protein B6D44_09875 [Ignavibacteriales bacterium UTCHB2]|mgnify:CR=1 FL=1|jgi:hypothetical protein|nr:MAG: hypothetical protein BWY38_01980 [Ignavibacteria bacterium ADurb.Bin266]OQY72530.1 MAG: hypothetical protein B6D44_09875 [Ignavibacteriales bacterium UTCHB2]HQI41872.1 DUF5668 domain-containing protein [Ignavibacteriaceae bacterium]
MKTSSIFWGVFFLAIGVLLLLGNYTNFSFSWDTVWKFWPTVLVLIGISILVKNKTGKIIVAALAALVLAFTIYASVSATTNLFNNDFELNFGEGTPLYDTTYFSKEYTDSVKTAVLNFSAGAGNFKILGSTEKLFDFTSEGSKNNYDLKMKLDEDNSHADIQFKMKNTKFNLGTKNYKNLVEMSLNTKPDWELNFGIGAASVDLDLTPYKISKLDIDMGAAKLKIKLGDLSEVTRVDIDAGASDIEILIPDSVGCEINSDAALSNRNYEGFVKTNKDIYRNEDFDKYSKKIYIDIDCGVSSIEVKRY